MAPPKKQPARPLKKPSTEAKPQPPDWPAFKPLLPSSDLSLTPVVESQIVTIRNFWTSTLCKTYVAFLGDLPLTTTPGKPKKGDALRVNDRFQVVDPIFANRLWLETGLREIVNGSGGEDEMTKGELQDLW